jgi:hypothetical protein
VQPVRVGRDLSTFSIAYILRFRSAVPQPQFRFVSEAG